MEVYFFRLQFEIVKVGKIRQIGYSRNARNCTEKAKKTGSLYTLIYFKIFTKAQIQRQSAKNRIVFEHSFLEHKKFPNEFENPCSTVYGTVISNQASSVALTSKSHDGHSIEHPIPSDSTLRLHEQAAANSFIAEGQKTIQGFPELPLCELPAFTALVRHKLVLKLVR